LRVELLNLKNGIAGSERKGINLGKIAEPASMIYKNPSNILPDF